MDLVLWILVGLTAGTGRRVGHPGDGSAIQFGATPWPSHGFG